MEAIAANILLEGLAVNALAQCETPVTLVTTDSREVCPGCIFVAFPGEKFDGHDFAAKALENGALCVVLNHPVEGVPEEKSVICPDSYHAMMVLGANYRSQFHPKVVGVTGSVPEKRIYGISNKIGNLDMKGEIHTYQDMNNQSEKVHIMLKDFTYGFMLTNIENFAKITLSE